MPVGSFFTAFSVGGTAAIVVTSTDEAVSDVAASSINGHASADVLNSVAVDKIDAAVSMAVAAVIVVGAANVAAFGCTFLNEPIEPFVSAPLISWNGCIQHIMLPRPSPIFFNAKKIYYHFIKMGAIVKKNIKPSHNEL